MVVGGYISMLLKERGGPLSDQQRHLLQEAEKSTKRLSALIAEMSEVSKLEAGATTFTRARLELERLLKDSIAALPPLPDRETEVSLENEAPAAEVSGDPVQLKGAFTALLTALRRELVTSTALIVHVRREADGSRQRLRLSIAGSEDIETLKQAPLDTLVRFYELRGGCGLSLVIARRIIAAHDGRIWSPEAAPSDAVTDDNVDRAARTGAVVVVPEA